MFKELDFLIHSQLRLAVVSHLISTGKSDFKDLKTVTQATAWNLSIQLKKLVAAEYITLKKSFLDNYPHTAVAITKKGIQAFDAYVTALKQYIK